MTIKAGMIEGGDALLSGTANNPNQGSRPIGWNLLEPHNLPALVNEAGQLVTPSGDVVGGSVVSGAGSITGVGDSLMAYGDGNLAGGGGPFPTSQSIPAWAFGGMQGVNWNITNRAAGSTTIAVMLANQIPNALADNTSGLWIHSGINDLNPSIDTTIPTVETIVARMKRVLDIVSSAKDYVILDALAPLAPDSISGAAPRRADIPRVNAGFRALAEQYANVFYNDVYTPLALDETSGTARPFVTLSTDGIHLTTRGAKLAGDASIATLRRVAFRNAFRTVTTFMLPEITGTGGTKTASTGTINGAVATGYNIQIATNATGVVITAEVLPGGRQRMRIQNGNAAASVCRFQLASFTDYLTGLASGDIVRAGCVVEVIEQSGLYRHDFSVQQNPSGTVYNILSMQKSGREDGSGDSFPLFPEAPYSLQLRPHGALTATPTSLNVALSVEVAPGGDVTMDISALTLSEIVAI